MERAYFEALSESFSHLVEDTTTLAAFGGAGPMSAVGAAELAGIGQVLIPRTAAVFSALGIAFSDIGKTYEVAVPEPTTESATATYDDLLVRAERDMFQEGYHLDDCTTEWQLTVENPDGSSVLTDLYRRGDNLEHSGKQVSLQLTATAALPHPELAVDTTVQTRPAPSTGTRSVRSAIDVLEEIPVHVLEELEPGHSGQGPAIVEGPFFTARILGGWTFRVTSAGDLLVNDNH
jgi:N-methylhydantoinase A/oxoprolinase/acetone carboxylase beta subunit